MTAVYKYFQANTIRKRVYEHRKEDNSLWVWKEKIKQNIKEHIPNNKNTLENKKIPQGKQAWKNCKHQQQLVKLFTSELLAKRSTWIKVVLEDWT